jgi:O-antigen ligase
MDVTKESPSFRSPHPVGSGLWLSPGSSPRLPGVLRRASGWLAAVLAWTLFAVIYLGLQASLPYVVKGIPAYFVVLFTFLMLGAVAFLAGSDKRWRFVLVIAFFLIMSGELPVFFGATRLNTRVIETGLRLLLMAFVAIDTLALKRRVWPPFWIILIFAFQIAILIASWVDAEYITEIQATREVVIAHIAGIFLFVAAFVYARSWKHVVSFSKVMVAGACAFAVLGIIEYFAGESYYRLYLRAFPGMQERIYLAVAHHRVIGPFDNQVAFGSWLAMFVVIPLALRANEVLFKKRLILSVALAIIWLCLFFTGSRGPFLGAFFGFLIYSWLTGRVKKAFAINIFAAFMVLLVVAHGARIAKILPDNNLILRFVDPAAARRSGGDVFATVRDARLEAWRDAVAEWRQRPVLGIGPGEWTKRRQQIYEQGKVTTVSAFSPYLLYLVETGILGLGCVLLLMAVLAGYNVRMLAALRPGPKRDLIAALSVSCLVVHLVSLTDVGYGINRLFYFFWAAQGVLLSGARLAIEEQTREAEGTPGVLQGWRRGWGAPSRLAAVSVASSRVSKSTGSLR